MRDPTQRFSDRVADYIKYRPGYPEEIVHILEREAGIRPGKTRVADIGAGTGISAVLFEKHGYDVIAVEPNDAMRDAIPDSIRKVSGTAEATTLEPRSVDLALAAQAFHWFDRKGFRAELERILAPNGITAIVWNARRVDTPFLREYEDVLFRLGIDYDRVRHQEISADDMRAFYGGKCTFRSVPNHQDFDKAGLIGRALSSSYVPKPGQPNHEALMRELERLFDAYAENGLVRFVYDTELWFG